MKIVKLTAENFKRLVAVEITPDGNVVKIAGRNGAGKSSVLDSIVAALGGGKEAPAMPIRAGQDKSVVVVETNEYTITRTFTEKGSYLKITNKEGFEARSPQGLLNRIVGQIAFDPLAFIREKDTRVQRELLLNLVGLDLSAIDAKITQTKTEASLVRRQLNAAKVSLEQLPDPGDAGNEEATIDVTALVEELSRGNQHNAARIAHKKRRDSLANEAKELREQLQMKEAELELEEKALREIGPFVEVEPLEQKIADTKAHNAEVEAHNKRVRAAAIARERRAATEAAAAKVKEQLDAGKDRVPCTRPVGQRGRDCLRGHSPGTGQPRQASRNRHGDLHAVEPHAPRHARGRKRAGQRDTGSHREGRKRFGLPSLDGADGRIRASRGRHRGRTHQTQGRSTP